VSPIDRDRRGPIVEVRIGIQNSPRELSFESAETPAAVQEKVSAALESGAKVLTLSDDGGRLYIVPATTLAYVEVGSEKTRRVGFVA
jgi:hypothetical protein